MTFRVGLHLGDVLVDGDDVYGDGVNVASRLESQAPAGGDAFRGTFANAVEGRLKAISHDLWGPLSLRNIERPVQAFRVEWRAEDWREPSKAQSALPATSPPPLPLPDKPSIAVLPFANMSGDVEQEHFTDGISEDLITELSRFRSLFVIARNSSFSYKGKSPDIRQVGLDLGVQYVVEGSIRRVGDRIESRFSWSIRLPAAIFGLSVMIEWSRTYLQSRKSLPRASCGQSRPTSPTRNLRKLSDVVPKV